MTRRPLHAVAVVLAVVGCGSPPAPPVTVPAHVVDAFDGTAIDRARWTVVNAQPGPDPFTVSEGRLRFLYTAGGGGIGSTETPGRGFYSARFFDFASTNCEAPGSHRGAFAGRP